MAVFPDKISLKNTTDSSSQILSAINPGGTDPIAPGELVVSRASGAVSLYALDSQNNAVVVGTDTEELTNLPAYIVQNFENDNTETAYVTDAMFVTVPDTTDPKFGTGALFFDHDSESLNYSQNLEFRASTLPGLISSSPWTMEFWVKSNNADWYLQGNGAAGPGPRGFLSIFGLKGLPRGYGALNVYLDAGTINNVGYGTTSRSDVVQGALCLGLWPGDTSRTSNVTGLPDTGEILCSGTTSVGDGAYHYVAIQHEGSGSYSMYIDGTKVDSNRLGKALVFGSDFDGETVVAAPYSPILGGQSVNVDGVSAVVDMYGFNGFIDGFRLIKTALYPFFGNIPVPTAGPSVSELVPLPTLKGLSDVSISFAPVNNSVLQYDSTTQRWVDNAAPAFDISANILDDLSDVNITTPVTDDYLKWTGSEWVNSPVLLENLGNIAPGTPAVGEFLVWNGSIYERNQSTVCILSSTEPALRPGGSIIRDGDQWFDITTQDFYVRSGGVFVLTAGGGSGSPVISIDDLTDVDTTTRAPISGDTLAWNGGLGIWEPVTQPPANVSGSSVHDLADVDPTLVADRVNGYALIWNGSAYQHQQINYSNITGQGLISSFVNDLGYLREITAQSIGDLVDVDKSPTSYPYTTGDILIYSEADNWYTPVDNGWLFDTNITRTPNSGDVIVWDGLNNEWVASAGSGGGGAQSLDDLGDVTISTNNNANDTVTFNGYDSFILQSNNGYGNVELFQRNGSEVSDEAGINYNGVEVNLIDSREIQLKTDTIGTFRLLGDAANQALGLNNPKLIFDQGNNYSSSPTGFYVSLQPSSSTTESVDYRFPPADGDSGQVLSTDGQGQTSWVDNGGGGTTGGIWILDPAGSTPNYQGEFTFDSFTWSTATKIYIGIIDSTGAGKSDILKMVSENNGLINVDDTGTQSHLFRVIEEVDEAGSLVRVFRIELINSSSTGLAQSPGQKCELSFYPFGTRVDDLFDVDAATPAEGNALIYNSTSQKWEAQVIETGGSSGRGSGGNFETGETSIGFTTGIYGGGNFETGAVDLPFEQTSGLDGGLIT